MRASTATPADPSAFMITSVQVPSAGSQLSCWVPVPLASTVQKSCSVGRPGRGAAREQHLVGRRGVQPEVVDDGALHAGQVGLDVARSGRSPRKTSSPASAPVTSRRAVPSAAESGTQSASGLEVDPVARRAYPAVENSSVAVNR